MAKRVQIEASQRDASSEGIEIEYAGEVFLTRSRLPGLTLLKIAAATDESAAVSEQITAMLELLKMMIIDYERFEEVMLDVENPASQEDVSSIVETIVSEFSGRPTEQPSSLPVGGAATDPSSAVDKLAGVLQD